MTVCASATSLDFNTLQYKVGMLSSSPALFAPVGLTNASLTNYTQRYAARVDFRNTAGPCIRATVYYGKARTASRRRGTVEPVGSAMFSIKAAMQENASSIQWSVYNPESPYGEAVRLGAIAPSTGSISSGTSFDYVLFLLVACLVVHVIWVAKVLYDNKKHREQKNAKKRDALAATVAKSIKSGTMKSRGKDGANTADTTLADDATWVVETEDFTDPWALDSTEWDGSPDALAAMQQTSEQQANGTSTPYYDYVADRRRSTLPYDHRGVAELYVEDLEFEPTDFKEYDDTAEFAY